LEPDDQLQLDVYEELKSDPRVTATSIRVSVRDGVVMLTGKASNYAEKLAAVNATKKITGVKEVTEDIEVRLPFSQRRKDEDIEQAILNALTWNLWVPNDVKVTVANGWVTLIGEVSWEFQKSEAENIVRHLIGVRGISSLISIRSSDGNHEKIKQED
jgi:osmotically-inducible protein OsmY